MSIVHLTFNYLSNTISLLSGGTATAPTRCSPAMTTGTTPRTRKRSPPPRCCCSASSSPRSPPRARPPWRWRAGGCGPGTSTSRAPPPARTTTPPSTRPRPSPPSTQTAPPATPTTGQPSPCLFSSCCLSIVVVLDVFKVVWNGNYRDLEWHQLFPQECSH